MLLRFGIRHCHHDRERGAVGGTGEPFVAIDHKVISVQHGACTHPGGVGARMIGFGHSETTANFSFE